MSTSEPRHTNASTGDGRGPIHGGITERDGERAELPDIPTDQPPPGQGGIVMLGLVVGLLLMGLQLWLLTVAFDLYLAGQRLDTLIVALCSGLVFLGGLVMLAFVSREPSRRS